MEPWRTLKNGTFVRAGETLFTFENSKAIFDLESKNDGYFYTNVILGEEYNVGSVVGYLFKSYNEKKSWRTINESSVQGN